MIRIGSIVLRVDDLQRQTEFWRRTRLRAPGHGESDDFVLLARPTAPGRTSTSAPATRVRTTSSWSGRLQGADGRALTWQTKQLLARETRRRGIAVLGRPELVVEIALDGVSPHALRPAASRSALPA